MQKEVLVIPDVHGRTFWKEPAHNHHGKIVFLGDYNDPYPYEGITPEASMDNFQEIIDFARQNKDRVTLLLGNHDMHYYSLRYQELLTCWRFDEELADVLNFLYTENKSLFSLAWEYPMPSGKILFTHAGVTKGWYNAHKGLIGPLSADNLNKLLGSEEGLQALAEVSQERGGLDPYGSMIWAHISEMDNTAPFDGIYQIFGHTQQTQDPVVTQQYACVDCRRTFLVP